MEEKYFVYILANKTNGTLYIGCTSNLVKRVLQHKRKAADGFTKKYDINKLVYYNFEESKQTAFQKEKQLKKWNRSWKTRLIQEMNPMWRDLYGDLLK